LNVKIKTASVETDSAEDKTMKRFPSESLFISPVVARHGVIALNKVVAEMEADARKDPTPEDYNPNDHTIYMLTLEEMERALLNGYEEKYWYSRPFDWFASIMAVYLSDTPDIPEDERIAIMRLLSEYHIRNCLQLAENDPDLKERAVIRFMSNLSRIFICRSFDEI